MSARRKTKRAPRIPHEMKAAAIDHFGGPARLKIHKLPVPQPADDEVLISVHAAGIGSWDASARDGSWKSPGRTKFPMILGVDGAGIVVAKGPRVRRLKVGDEVYGYEFGNPKGGFYAEYAVAHANNVARLPKALDLLHAGAAATTGLTALQGVDDALRLRRGQTILILGATGAVGTAAVQFAKRKDARVIATASGRSATQLARELGADAVVDARSEAVVEQLKALAPKGLDVALVLGGNDRLEEMLDLVRAGGRIAYPNGVDPEPRRRRNVKVVGYDGIAGPREFARLERAVEEAKLRVPLARVSPLAQAQIAHKQLEHGHVLGRMVLRVR